MVIHYISKDSHQSQQHAWVGKGRDHSFNFFGGQSNTLIWDIHWIFQEHAIGLGPLFLYQMIIVITSYHSSLMTIIMIVSNRFFFMMIHEGHSTVATACMGIRDHSPLSFKKSLKCAICKLLPCFVASFRFELFVLYTKQRAWSVAIYNQVWFECNVI